MLGSRLLKLLLKACAVPNPGALLSDTGAAVDGMLTSSAATPDSCKSTCYNRSQ